MYNNKIICNENNGYGVILNDFMSLKEYLGLTDIDKEINNIWDIKHLYSQNKQNIGISLLYTTIIICHYCGTYKEYLFSDYEIAKKVYDNLKYNSNVDDVGIYELSEIPDIMFCVARRNNKGKKLFLRFLDSVKKLKKYSINDNIITYDNGFYIKYRTSFNNKKVVISEIARLINFNANRDNSVREQLESDFGWDVISHPAEGY